MGRGDFSRPDFGRLKPPLPYTKDTDDREEILLPRPLVEIKKCTSLIKMKGGVNIGLNSFVKEAP
jgi:hypothetical protein